MAMLVRGKRPLFLLLLSLFGLTVIVLYQNRRWVTSFFPKPNCDDETPRLPPWVIHKEAERNRQPDLKGNRRHWKTVLYWTPFWGCQHPDSVRGADLFVDCQVSSCFITPDRSFLQEAHAVLYHIFDLDPDDLPPRKPSQYNVFHNREPATYLHTAPDAPNGFFDMVFSYRLDSEVPYPYTYKVPLQKTRMNFAQGRTKLVAWYASKCPTHSRREDYVAELSQHIKMDAYGKCGTLTCSRDNMDLCDDMLGRDYKFYLAFENSLCRDYLTEKTMRALAAGVVPVVMASSSLDTLPPKSFLNVADFPDAGSLARHLAYLDRNDTAYNEYFEWRYHLELTASYGKYAASQTSYCKLCELLHSPDFKPKPYLDAKKWFMKTAECQKLPGEDPDTW